MRRAQIPKPAAAAEATDGRPLTRVAGEFLAVSGEGDVYNEQDVDRWSEASGWKRIDRRDVAGSAGLIMCEAV